MVKYGIEQAGNSSPPLALTMGDPSGIGLDIAIAAFENRVALDLSPFIFLGDIAALQARADILGRTIEVDATEPEHAADIFSHQLPAMDIKCQQTVVAGQPNSDNSDAILQSIKSAVSLTLAGRTSAIVTNPIAKSVLYQAGFAHPGHTEYLAELACTQNAEISAPPLPIMMLAGPLLKTVPVTIHIPLFDIQTYLTMDLIVRTCQIVARDLTHRFGIRSPRLAVSGLNPHAGENGALGSEDSTVIAPAIDQLQQMGIDAFGPLPADSMFHEDARAHYDAAICMYHDQALIPAKALGFHDAVNVTLGLPFIRTSPDHGTAFDIAGKNLARCDSLVAAIKMAADMASTQAQTTAAEIHNGSN